MAQAFWGLKPKSQFRLLGHILPMASLSSYFVFSTKKGKRRDLLGICEVKTLNLSGKGMIGDFLSGYVLFSYEDSLKFLVTPGDFPSGYTRTILSVDASTNWGNFKEIDSSYIRCEINRQRGGVGKKPPNETDRK